MINKKNYKDVINTLNNINNNIEFKDEYDKLYNKLLKFIYKLLLKYKSNKDIINYCSNNLIFNKYTDNILGINFFINDFMSDVIYNNFFKCFKDSYILNKLVCSFNLNNNYVISNINYTDIDFNYYNYLTFLINIIYGNNSKELNHTMNSNIYGDFSLEDYSYLIYNHKFNNEIDEYEIIHYLNNIQDFETLRKVFDNNINKEDLYNKIINNTRYSFFIDVINKKNNNYTNLYGLNFNDIEEYLINTLNEKNINYANDIFKNSSLNNFIYNGINNYNYNFNNEVDKCKLTDNIKICYEFLNTINNDLALLFMKCINKNTFIFNKKEEDYFMYKDNKCYINLENNYNDSITIIHEFIHYITNIHNDIINIDKTILEFPSIYFETLMTIYLNKLNIKTNWSIDRHFKVLDYYNILKDIFTINDNLYMNGNIINYEKLYEDIINKHDINYIDELIINSNEYLDPNTLEDIISYIFGVALTTNIIDNNIDTSEVLDICYNLNDYNNIYELMDRFNINNKTINNRTK